MTTDNLSTKQFTKRIVVIVFLTNIPALMFLPTRFPIASGWFLGTVGSALNFYWLSVNVQNNINVEANKSRLKSFKGFYLRFLVLTAYAVGAVGLIKPDILSFGLGLLSAQIAIYGYYLFDVIAKKIR